MALKPRAWTSVTEDLILLQKHAPKGILGMDEVGRGCVAGPIVAAGVFLSFDEIPKLKDRVCDSKKLSEPVRNRIAAELAAEIPHSIALRSADYIDANGIQAANMGIFADLIAIYADRIGIALIDGTQAPKGLVVPVQTIPKGESHSVAIAAASLIAKAHRDALMRAVHEIHPQYGFADHKGYGTPAHTATLREHGLLKGVHRTVFCRSLLAN